MDIITPYCVMLNTHREITMLGMTVQKGLDLVSEGGGLGWSVGFRKALSIKIK